MKNMADIMRQAQEMQSKLAEAQEQVERVEADGVAGAGLVKMTLKGKGEMVSLAIDPSLMADDAEILEDLIKAAHNEARRGLEVATEKAMKEATAGLGGLMPGFKMPF
ncbi:MAG: YbaB/EbfC family nucleoid-associated protein [Pseudomonadota bacterium]